jgi:two-component system, OmpR family, phosphate regulon sensor histidine kinase PhoR
MKPITIFYLLIFYIVLQFFWWAYLLFDLNQEIYLLHGKLSLESGIILQKKLHKKWIMIAGEGAVFLLILGVGTYKTLNAYKREINLNQRQKNFLLSITHEFKSPLASIKLYLQTFLKHELEKEKKELFLRNSLSDVERLDNLVENALFAAQIESRKLSLHESSLNISDLIINLIQNHRGKDRIKTKIEPGIILLSEQHIFSSLVLNLIENALKYSPEESLIEVELIKLKKVILIIKDQGEGIPGFEKDKVFEKFYRIGNENTRKSKGTGLGLFIVKNIVTLHKGRLILKENHPSGTIVEISFPV